MRLHAYCPFRAAKCDEDNWLYLAIIREDQAQLAACLPAFEETSPFTGRYAACGCAYLYDLAGLSSGFRYVRLIQRRKRRSA